MGCYWLRVNAIFIKIAIKPVNQASDIQLISMLIIDRLSKVTDRIIYVCFAVLQQGKHGMTLTAIDDKHTR